MNEKTTDGEGKGRPRNESITGRAVALSMGLALAAAGWDKYRHHENSAVLAQTGEGLKAAYAQTLRMPREGPIGRCGGTPDRMILVRSIEDPTKYRLACGDDFYEFVPDRRTRGAHEANGTALR